MTGAAARRARLLRLRRFEHRISAARLIAATAAHAAIVSTAERVAALRDGVTMAQGMQHGRDLQSRGELIDRLDRACEGLAPTLATTQSACALRDAERRAAWIAEERIARVDASASQREAVRRELLAAAFAVPGAGKRGRRS